MEERQVSLGSCPWQCCTVEWQVNVFSCILTVARSRGMYVLGVVVERKHLVLGCAALAYAIDAYKHRIGPNIYNTASVPPVLDSADTIHLRALSIYKLSDDADVFFSFFLSFFLPSLPSFLPSLPPSFPSFSSCLVPSFPSLPSFFLVVLCCIRYPTHLLRQDSVFVALLFNNIVLVSSP